MSETENAPLLNTTYAAAILGLSPSTLSKLRCFGGGPPFLKLGRKVCYRPSDLVAWLSARRVDNTSQAILSLPRRLTDPLRNEPRGVGRQSQNSKRV
jgi:hypothetical protein